MSTFRSIFKLKNMITPSILPAVYGILLRLFEVAGVVMIGLFLFEMVTSGFNITSVGILVALELGIIIGILVLRIICESILVLFKINDNLQAIAQKNIAQI